MSITKSRWDNVNWELTNAMIARELGVSPAAVRQMRQKKKKPPSPFKGRHEKSALWILQQIPDEVARELTIPEFAKKAGVQERSVYGALKKLRKLYKKRPQNWSKKYNWETVKDWSRLDYEIATELGIENPAQVSGYRKRHGLPPSPYRNRGKK